MYSDELIFEHDLIELLRTKKGWKKDVLKRPTEKDLIKNWAEILFNNNRSIDRLGDYPLTDTEMEQIINQIEKLSTPLKINGFINGKTCSIKRDNPDDVAHFGKEIRLKIYDRDEIAAGQSIYQIAEQPIFSKKSPLLPDRRGDFMLLINGMPVIHVELKKSGIPISQAQFQIEKYSKEGLFTGIFSLIQIFVAMTPEEMTYFANPGPGGVFNSKFYFHWEDFNNEIVNDWEKIADQFLSIPMAHQLIGFYTVPDETDGILKVMRSYQYYAASRISDVVSRTDWESKRDDKGGYIWHTTGSGKTMTSFKAAQLIANSKDADKVVFLMDRIELGTQSLLEYRGFADDSDEVQSTESTEVLKNKLLSPNPSDTLIVTSIQKMSRLKKGETLTNLEAEKLNKKRIVIIIDECHRSVFGDSLITIRDNFKNALLFGFSGTPIQKENEKKSNNTMTIFGNELHRYSISDGIRDKNVLGFDTYQVETFAERDIREKVALEKAKANSVSEAIADERKKKIFYEYMDSKPMASYVDADGNYVKGIEEYIPNSQYDDDKHRKMVCEHILKDWGYVSRNHKYHAILATSSIKEACAYYSMFKKLMSDEENTQGYPVLRICSLFDEHTDNSGGDFEKETAIVEMLTDYNSNYGTNFTIPSYQNYKKDVSRRLAHKKPYKNINYDTGLTIDLLIVVNQTLTGFDSSWINCLYLDKDLEYENIVQAFSRTNRLNDDDKPFGIIKYYRRPHTMKKAVEEAFRVYSGDKPYGIFVDKLGNNLKAINVKFGEIKSLFESNGIQNFESNPSSKEDKNKFVLLYNELYRLLEASKVQGFRWSKLVYKFPHGEQQTTVEVELDENTYNILLVRYKELFIPSGGGGDGDDIPPYDVNPTLVTSSAAKIDHEYMEAKFKKYIKELQINGSDSNLVHALLNEVRKTFASLSQEDQKIANIIIHDIQSGDLKIGEDDTFLDVLNSYKNTKKDENIREFSKRWGIPEIELRKFIKDNSNYRNINEYGRLDNLMSVTDIQVAIDYVVRVYNQRLNRIKANKKIIDELKAFLGSNCMELDD